MKLHEMGSIFKRSLEATRSIGKVMISEEQLADYLATIEEINNLDWQEEHYQGIPLEKWKVAEAFRVLLAPRYVKVQAGTQYPDLLVKVPTLQFQKGVKPLSMVQFNAMSSEIMGVWKREEVIDVESNRTGVVLTDVIDRGIYVDGKEELVTTRDAFELPLLLKNPENLLVKSKYSEHLQTQFEELILEHLRGFKTRQRS